jgi:hypothetical protein
MLSSYYWYKENYKTTYGRYAYNPYRPNTVIYYFWTCDPNKHFGSKDRVERKKTWGSASLLMGKSSSNDMRLCGKHFKKEDYIFCKLNTLTVTKNDSL